MRKDDQAVVIESSDHFEHILRVAVPEINGASARPGFEANRDVVIHREKVLSH
ncbi:MAG: hypothetical protein HOP29_13885 [Phycisphaerales bacterium]|nr:hypothetical protein [Phycisphaerales bacterium]